MDISFDILGKQVGDAMNEYVEEDVSNRAMGFVILNAGMEERKDFFISGANGFESNLQKCMGNLLARIAIKAEKPGEWLSETFYIATDEIGRLKHGEYDTEEDYGE